MKVRFNLESGAHSNSNSNHQSEWMDTVDDLGLAKGEWESMNHDDKFKVQLVFWNENGHPEYWAEEEK